MNEKVKPGLAVGAVLLATLGGGAAALARGGGAASGSRPLDRQALLEEAASRLGVEPAELRRALLGALAEELEKAVEAGRMTEAQAERIEERARARGGLPLLGARGGEFGHRRGGFAHGRGHRLGLLDAAASYLEQSVSELRDELRGGKTLAEVAAEEGKSVAGLREALVEAAREKLQERVDAGQLTQERADRAVARLSDRIGAIVEGTFQRPHRDGAWRGQRRG